MNPLLRTGIVVAVLMIAAPVPAWLLTPSKSIADTAPQIDLEKAIPKQFGGWRMIEGGVSLVPAAAQEEALNAIYSQIVSRTYINGQGERIMLSVAYGSTQTKQLRAHRQEVCYAAQGFKIDTLRKENISIKGIEVPATRMLATMGSRSEPVTYWFTMGNQVVRSYLDRELVQMKYAVSGYLPDGYLFRMSTISKDPKKAFENQHRFATELFTAMDKRLVTRLLGQPTAAPEARS